MRDLNKIPDIHDLITDAQKTLFSIASGDSPEEKQATIAEARAYLEIARTIIEWNARKIGGLR